MKNSSMRKSPPSSTGNKPPLFVGGSRNCHGTRICHRIECTQCGAEDYISSRVRKEREKLCRRCAQKLLNAYEVGTQAPLPTVKKHCSTCQTEFQVPLTVSMRKPTLLCLDCLRGFSVWRGSLSTKPEKRNEVYVQSRSSNILLRRKSGGADKTAKETTAKTTQNLLNRDSNL